MTLHSQWAAAASSRQQACQNPEGSAPDNQRLVDVSPGCEGDDVVAATQLREGVCLGVLLQFHAACTIVNVHHACSSTPFVTSILVPHSLRCCHLPMILKLHSSGQLCIQAGSYSVAEKLKLQQFSAQTYVTLCDVHLKQGLASGCAALSFQQIPADRLSDGLLTYLQSGDTLRLHLPSPAGRTCRRRSQAAWP